MHLVHADDVSQNFKLAAAYERQMQIGMAL
jgi:hypothetical protein